MKRKKGFTLIELLGVIILLGIILTIAVVSYSSSLNKTKVKAFKLEEGNFIDATKSAYVDCLSNNPSNTFCRTHQQLEEKYTYEFIYLKELIDDKYIEEIKNPYDVEQFCDVEKSYVYVSRKNSSQADSSDMVYKACLICGDHKSENCLDDDLDYSSFYTTCTAYYDVNSGELYDGNWTDRNVYLVFGASGNYRYGINEFEYTINDSSTNTITANNSNTATLNLKESVGNKTYKVQAFDGMNGKGTIVSCGANIKIDKGTINSVNIKGTTASGKNVTSNGWVTEQVTLTANVEPNNSTSGYLYQWYYNGNKYGEQTTSNTLTVQSKGTYNVEVTNQVGNIVKKSSDFTVNVDTKAPTCELAAIGTKYNDVYTSDVTISFKTVFDMESGTVEGSGVKNQSIDIQTVTENIKNKVITGTVTDGVGRVGTCTITITKDNVTPTITSKEDNNYIDPKVPKPITDYFDIEVGPSGGETVCKVGNKEITNTSDLEIGVNTVTCTTTGNNGKVTEITTTFRHKYDATAKCSSGTLQNGSCYFSSNASVCGTTCHYGCDIQWNNCLTTNNTCVGGYTDECKTTSCKQYKSCDLVKVKGYCKTVSGGKGSACSDYGWVLYTETTSIMQQATATCSKACSYGYVFDNETENRTDQKCGCETSYCSEYVYNSCITGNPSECVGGNEQVNCSACKTQTNNSCYKDNYLSYSCPTNGKNGDTGEIIIPTLNGKICSF